MGGRGEEGEREGKVKGDIALPQRGHKYEYSHVHIYHTF